MRITKVSVKKLFRFFDYEFAMNPSRITIMHGPNGRGKTTVLSMIDGLCSLEYEIFYQVPFQVFRVDFDNGESIELHSANSSPQNSMIKLWVKHFDAEDSELEMEALFSGKEPEWLLSVVRHVSTRLIVTQRLVSQIKEDPSLAAFKSSHSTHAPQLAVEVYANEFARTSEDFSRKLESAKQQIDMITNLLTEIRSLASDEGSLDSSKQASLDEKMQIIRPLIVEVERQHSEYDEFSDQIDMLTVLIDKRYEFKTLEVREERGFVIVGHDGHEIPIANLSTGEQHQLVLFYQLLFGVEPETLVLIDEPELSLNVTWQRSFLNDLQDVIKLRSLDVLLATHSPQIVHDKWDWMVPLGEAVGE